MKHTKPLTISIILILLISLSVLSVLIECSKKKEAYTPQQKIQPLASNSITDIKEEIDKKTAIDEKDLLIPEYKKLIRYKQKSNESCLITCIYMLIHTSKGLDTPINETHAEYFFNGEENTNKAFINEDLLAKKNNLTHKFLGKTVGDDSNFLNPDKKDICIKQLKELLQKNPFILGLPGHAVLVIGLHQEKEELILVNPLHPEENERININYLSNCSEIFYLE